MQMAAHSGDRAAMLFMAKAYETGIGLDGDKWVISRLVFSALGF